MSEYKFTPGPWRFGEFQFYEGAVKRFSISQASSAKYTPNYSDVATTIPGERLDIQEANACLIASAPELFRLLAEKAKDAEQQEFEGWLLRNAPSGDSGEIQAQWEKSSEYCDYCDSWNEALMILAKASGETE